MQLASDAAVAARVVSADAQIQVMALKSKAGFERRMERVTLLGDRPV